MRPEKETESNVLFAIHYMERTTAATASDIIEFSLPILKLLKSDAIMCQVIGCSTVLSELQFPPGKWGEPFGEFLNGMKAGGNAIGIFISRCDKARGMTIESIISSKIFGAKVNFEIWPVINALVQNADLIKKRIGQAQFFFE